MSSVTLETGLPTVAIVSSDYEKRCSTLSELFDDITRVELELIAPFLKNSKSISKLVDDLEGKSVKSIDFREASLSFAKKSYQISQKIGDFETEASSLNLIGSLYMRRGNWQNARESFQEVLHLTPIQM